MDISAEVMSMRSVRGWGMNEDGGSRGAFG